MGLRHRRDWAIDLAFARRGHQRAHGRGRALFLRRHRPHRLHESIDMDVAWMAVALRQGRPGRQRRGLHQLPDLEGAIRGVHRCAARRREDRIQGLGEGHALFRGLPAHRGDGGARARNPALWADETRGARRSAHRPLALRRGAAPAGQRAGHALEHGGLPDQAEAWRADAHFPHDSRAGARHLRAARRPASQHLPEQPQAARHAIAAQGRSAPALRRAGYGRRGLCGVGGNRALAGKFAAAGREAAPPPPTTALGALLAHITGGHLSDESSGAARSFQPMNVNFGLFPPIAEAAPEGKRLKGAARGVARKKALSARALADLGQWLNSCADGAPATA